MKIRKWIIPAIVFLFFFVLFWGFFYLSKARVSNLLLKPYLERTFSKALGIKIEIKQVDFSLANRSLNVYQVVSPSLLIIPEIHSTLELWQLFLGRLILKNVKILKPNLTWDQQTAPITKIQKIPYIPWHPFFRLKLKNLAIEQANIKLKTRFLELDSGELNCEMTPQKNGRYGIKLALQPTKFIYKNLPLRADHVAVSGIFSRKEGFLGNVSLKKITIKEKILPVVSFSVAYEKSVLQIDKLNLQSPFGPLAIRASFPLSNKMQIHEARFFINEVPFVFKKEGQKDDSGVPNHFRIYSSSVVLEKIFRLPFQISGGGSWNSDIYLRNGGIECTSHIQIEGFSAGAVFLGTMKGIMKWAVILSPKGEGSPLEISSEFTFKGSPLHTEGKFSASLNLAPKKISGGGFLSLKDFVVRKERFASLLLPFTVTSNGIHFPNIDLHKKKGHLYIQGSIFRDKSLNIKIRSQELAAEEFDTLPAFYRGPAQVDASIYGKIHNPSADLYLTIQELWLEKRGNGLSYIKGSLRDKKISLEASLLGGGWIQTAGIQWKKDFPYESRLQLSKFNFVPYVPFFKKEIFKSKGLLTGTVLMAGSLRRPSGSSLSADFSEVRLSRSEYEIYNSTPVVARFNQGLWELKPVRLAGAHTALLLEGSLSKDGNLSLVVEGDLNNEIFALMVPSFEKSSGNAKVSWRVGGSLTNPIFFGNYFLSDGIIKTSWFPHTLEQLNANITFSKNKISIHKLNGELGGGKIGVSGDILLKSPGSPQIDIHVDISDAQIQYPSWLSSRASGALYLKGIEKPYELGGDLLLSEVLYKENIDWESEILNFKRKPYFPKSLETSKPALRYHISIRAPKNVFVKNNLADLEAGMDLLLRGNNDQMILLGKMELISGTAIFKETTFKLNSAHVIFDNPVEMDPKFSILSETTAQEYKISMGIEGILSKYNIRLSSQPPLPESDIVSLLTFGALRSEIEKQESLDVTSLELGSLFFGGVQKAVESAARKSLGLKFRLSPSYSDTKHATVPRLLIGKTLAKNIDATFSSMFDKSSIFSEKELNLKYNLHKNLSFLGFFEDRSEEELQDNASFGLDFRVQFEFK